MDQEYVVAVTSGTRDDRDGLDQLISREHPQAKRLSNLTKLQTTARNRSAHELWLDESAEVLLYRNRERAEVGRPESEDRLTLYRIPLRSLACNQLLTFVSEAPKGYLEEQRHDTPYASSSAVTAMNATLQRLRHTVGTYLVAQGKILHACTRLRHGDVATTLRIYAHALPLDDEEVADYLVELFGLVDDVRC